MDVWMHLLSGATQMVPLVLVPRGVYLSCHVLHHHQRK